MQKIIRVNMGSRTFSTEDVPAEYKCLGGRGLTSRIISREVSPNQSALHSGAQIVLAPGLLSGTAAPCSGRLSIGAKSPLTGGIKESNVGGTASQVMARTGIKALIVEGKPDDGTFILEISGQEIAFRDAGPIRGKTNYEVGEFIRAEYGAKTSYICIGPAGEHMMPMATVAVGDLEGRPTRHAGRGGMGAVLGSKGIKAIVFLEKGKTLKAKDEAGYKAVSKELAKDLAATKKALSAYGTAVLVNVINENRAMPVNNFRHGSFKEVGKISGEILADNCKERGGKSSHACHNGCVIKCSNIYHDVNGNYQTSALEYETIVLLGSNCGLSDLDQIAELDYLCDNYGLDTMETGCTLAVAMEGGMLDFGDFEGMKQLIEEIRAATITGRLLGQGTQVTGRALGVERIPVVKGQSMSAYDPRVLKGTGTTYATSTMGADHTAGNCLPGRTGLDDRSPEGQVKASRVVQILTMLCDILGLCIFVGPVEPNMDFFVRLLNGYTGKEMTRAQVLELAEGIIRDEVAFNEKAGISKYQNDVPEFFRTEALHSGLVFDVDAEEMREIFS